MPRPFCVNRCFSSQSPREYHIIDVIDKFAMDARCSLSELRKSKSGDFRGSPFAVRRLLECKDDVRGHLQSCSLSKRCGHETESETLNFGTLSDLRVDIFYCCCNGTLGKSYPE